MDNVVSRILQLDEDEALAKVLQSTDEAWLSELALAKRAPPLLRKAALDRLYGYERFRRQVKLDCETLIKQKDDDEEVRLAAFQVLQDLTTQRHVSARTRGNLRARSGDSTPGWMREAECDPSPTIRAWAKAL